MGGPFGIDSDSLRRIFYAVQFIALVLALVFVAFPLDTLADSLLAVLFGGLILALAIRLWRPARGDAESKRLDTSEDITSDPIADPGQAAKHRWRKAIDRLPDDEDDRS